MALNYDSMLPPEPAANRPWGWELAGRGSKTRRVLSTAIQPSSDNYQDHVYLHLAWRKKLKVSKCCLRLPAGRTSGDGRDGSLAGCAATGILCWSTVGAVLGKPWHSHCLISGISIAADFQCSLVKGLFESSSLQAVAASFPIHGSGCVW